jgi:hypothetical protein
VFLFCLCLMALQSCTCCEIFFRLVSLLINQLIKNAFNRFHHTARLKKKSASLNLSVSCTHLVITWNKMEQNRSEILPSSHLITNSSDILESSYLIRILHPVDTIHVSQVCFTFVVIVTGVGWFVRVGCCGCKDCKHIQCSTFHCAFSWHLRN